jgi:hypothetical protein
LTPAAALGSSTLATLASTPVAPASTTAATTSAELLVVGRLSYSRTCRLLVDAGRRPGLLDAGHPRLDTGRPRLDAGRHHLC